MEQRIWKYELTPGRDTTLMMPRGARTLSAGVQGEALVIWAMVDPQATPEQRSFRVFPTGVTITEDDWQHGPSAFIATVQMGALVFHVFEYSPMDARH